MRYQILAGQLVDITYPPHFLEMQSNRGSPFRLAPLDTVFIYWVEPGCFIDRGTRGRQSGTFGQFDELFLALFHFRVVSEDIFLDWVAVVKELGSWVTFKFSVVSPFHRVSERPRDRLELDHNIGLQQ